MKTLDDAAGGRPAELLRWDLAGHGLAVFVAETTAVAVETEWRHLAGRTSASALARLMTATVLSGGFLDGSERLTLQVRSRGELGGLTAEVDAAGHVRCYSNVKSVPALDRGAPREGVVGIGADGALLAVRATDDRITYQGTVELRGGDVRSDVLRLLGQSEQRLAHLELLVDYDEQVRRAGGVLIEGLHDIDLDLFDEVGARLRRGEAEAALRAEADPAGVLARIVPAAAAASAQLVWRRALRFRCRCSRDKVRAMLLSLDPRELEEMLRDDRGATVYCHFCNDRYDFSEQDLAGLIAERRR